MTKPLPCSTVVYLGRLPAIQTLLVRRMVTLTRQQEGSSDFSLIAVLAKRLRSSMLKWSFRVWNAAEKTCHGLYAFVDLEQ
jgi:hypothetical protein